MAGPVLKVLVPFIPEIGQFRGDLFRLIAGNHDGFEEESDPRIAPGPGNVLRSTAVQLPIRGFTKQGQRLNIPVAERCQDEARR